MLRKLFINLFFLSIPFVSHSKGVAIFGDQIVKVSWQDTDSVVLRKDLDKAWALTDDAMYDSALALYDIIIKEAFRVKRWEQYIEALRGYGLNQSNLGQYEEALVTRKKLVNDCNEYLAKDNNNIGISYKELALSYGKIAKYPMCLKYLKKALNHQMEYLGESHPNTAITINSMGWTFNRLGKIDSALVYYQKALNIRTEILDKNDYSLGISLNNVGLIMGLKGDYEKQGDYYERAVNVFIKSRGAEHPLVATVYNNLANTYKKKGEYERQLLYLQKSLTIRKSHFKSLHPYIAESYHNLSIYYFDQDQLDKFFEYATMSLEINLALYPAGHIKIAANYQNIGKGYEKRQKYQKALNFYNKSHEIYLKLYDDEHQILATGYSNMASCYGKLDNPEKEQELLELALLLSVKALGNKNPTLSLFYENLGGYFVNQHQLPKALEHFQQALIALTWKFDDMTLVSNPSFEDASSKLQLLTILKNKAATLEKLYHESKEVKLLNNAYQTYKVAVGVADQIRFKSTSESSQQNITSQAMPAYEGVIRTALNLQETNNDKNFANEAFEYSERSKVYLLRQVIHKSNARKFTDIPDSLVLSEINLEKEIRSLEDLYTRAMIKKDSIKVKNLVNGIFNKKSNYDHLLKTLAKDYRKYYALKFDQTVSSIEEIQQNILNTETALIEFFMGDQYIYRFTITKDHYEVDKIKYPDNFTELISGLRKSTTDYQFIQTQSQESKQLYTKTAFALYDLLLADQLDKANYSINSLVIIPDEMLNQINFETFLTNQSSDSLNYKKLPYLAKQFIVNYAYSATLLKEVNNESKTSPSIDFGGFAPAYYEHTEKIDTVNHKMVALLVRDGKLSLPGAAEEVRQVNAFFNGDTWLGAEATENKFKEKAAQYRVLHLAMHGLVDDQNPMASELVFTKSENLANDGYLSIREIYNLDLNADLVVLSACNSGYGKVQKGEGNISLARGFIYAGSSSVIMSLWKIPDLNTKEIMIELYKNLSSNMKKGYALQQAKLKYISDTEDPLHAHPYYWAGFILTGDDGEISSDSNAILYGMIGLFIALLLIVFRRFLP